MSDRRLLLCAVFLALCVPCVSAQPASSSSPSPRVRIAAAADLQPVLPAILDAFQHQTGIRAQASYQSSATLATQIIEGAPFDLFLAADLSFPQRVIDAGRAEESQPIPYARGTLVLWTRNDSGISGLSIDTLRTITLRTLAIANPDHAPYGRAAQATLQHLGLLETLRPRLVIAENIAQAAQYADSGNAQAGFLSLTSALTPRLRAEGHFLRIPAEDYPPLLQGAVVIRNSRGAAEARRFLEFLHTPEAAGILAAGGLEPTH